MKSVFHFHTAFEVWLCAVWLLALVAPFAVACGGGPSEGPLRVVADFYPVQFLAGRIGGEAATVTRLTHEPRRRIVHKPLSDVTTDDIHTALTQGDHQ